MRVSYQYVLLHVINCLHAELGIKLQYRSLNTVYLVFATFTLPLWLGITLLCVLVGGYSALEAITFFCFGILGLLAIPPSIYVFGILADNEPRSKRIKYVSIGLVAMVAAALCLCFSIPSMENQDDCKDRMLRRPLMIFSARE